MTQIDSALGELVRLGLQDPSLSVLEQVLSALAQQCGGFGATLWQLREVDGAPPVRTKLEPIMTNPGKGQLYVLAHGFGGLDYKCAFHDLPLSMATGRAVLMGEFEVTDVSESPFVDHANKFTKEANPGSLYAVRVYFPDETVGAVTIYRREVGRYEDEVKKKFSFLASYVPALYASIRDRVAYGLVDKISGILAEAESVSRTEGRTSDQKDGGEDSALREICDATSKALGCLETSVFLVADTSQSGPFCLAATSCARLLRATVYSTERSGLTSYVLRTVKPLYVLDLASMPEWLRLDSNWQAWPELRSRVSELTGIADADDSHPLSFAAAPLQSDGKLTGVLRCTVCPKPPYFLAEREIALLEILASRIAGYWRRRQRLESIHYAEKSWNNFVTGLSELTQQTQTLTEKSKSTRTKEALRKEIFDKALHVLQSSIQGADTLEVALVDADRNTIGPISTLGKDWDTYMPAEKGQDQALRFPLSPSNDNSWAYVCHHKRLEFIENTSEPKIPYKGFLPKTRQALFAPVLVDAECIGILGIRSHSYIREPEKAKSMAMLVALVVALYYQLTTILTQQLQVYQDLEHQLRSPIFQAFKRIRLVVQEEVRNPTEQLQDRLYDLTAINGLLSKAKRVLGNVRLYEQLAMDQPIALHRVATPLGELVKLMIEAAKDNRLLWDHRRIGFRVDVASFEKLKIQEVSLDVALFEQVMNNLLDNAGKYGDPGCNVMIEGRYSEPDKLLEISVKNKGLRIDKEDLPYLGIRGFRSNTAKRRSAEGIGSGLFLVRNIMQVHYGKFIPHPTDRHGMTTMTVAFQTIK